MTFPMKDFSLKRFPGYNTAVFWDMDDCPIPDGLSASDVSENIRNSLKNVGCEDRVDIFVYGDIDKILVDGQLPQGFKELLKVPQGHKHKRRRGVSDGLFRWVLCNQHERSNLLLIIGDISDHHGLLHLLHQLTLAGHNFLIAQDSNCRRLPIDHDRRFEWRWPDLGRGSDPVFIEKVPDFSLRSCVASDPEPQEGNDAEPDLEDANDTDPEEDNDAEVDKDANPAEDKGC